MTYYYVFLVLAIIFLTYRIITLVLDIKSTKNEIPEYLGDIYKKDEYEKYLLYSNEKGRFAIIRTLVTSLFDIALFITPLFSLIANNVSNQYLSSLLILLTYQGISAFIDLPFEYYSTIKIEDKYGFNKSTKKTFVGDQVRSFLIGFILFYAIIVIFASLFDALKIYSMFVIAACLIIILLFIYFISPLMVGLSNKKTPLEDGELRQKLLDLLDSEGYKVKEIYVIDGSKRSSKANAFFTGIGKEKSIMLYDTLIELMTPEEIVAVFAHEMGHGKHKDSLKGFASTSLFIFSLVVVLVLIAQYLDIYKSFWFNSLNYGWMILILSSALLPFVSTLFGVLSSFLSRKHEYAADKMAKDKGYGKQLISALKKLAVNNFANLTPHPFIVKTSYSHPPIGDRIKALKD